jgi:methylated-DNA-protein-cysteine methyltransferase-like protein
VHAVIAALDAGDVASYAEVAARAGHPGAARAVGGVLARAEGLPWWRVVNAVGRLTPGHERLQASLLAQEDVLVRAGRVVGFATSHRRRARAAQAAPRMRSRSRVQSALGN